MSASAAVTWSKCGARLEIELTLLEGVRCGGEAGGSGRRRMRRTKRERRRRKRKSLAVCARAFSNQLTPVWCNCFTHSQLPLFIHDVTASNLR